MNKEIKEQAHKEFDERFVPQRIKNYADHIAIDKLGIPLVPEEIKSFIDSIIDKTISDYQTNFEQKHIVSAVKVERERIVGIIEESKDGSDGDVALDYVIKLIKRK